MTRPSTQSLREITAKIDKAWSSRQKADGTLGPLLYSAWQVFQGKVGAPKKGASTFSGYLRERGIPLSTAKDLIQRHRVSLGKIPAPKSRPEPESDPELDGPGQLDSLPEQAECEIQPLPDERSVADRKDFAIWRDAYDRTRNMDTAEFDEWITELFLTVEHRRGYRHGQTLTISGKPHQSRFHPDGSLKKTFVVSEKEAA